MTETVIISGFLGAGKTTFIQKLLKDCYKDKKVAIIENDFGEINLDSALLQESGFEVTDITNGCICCTLTGDFISALSSLIRSKAPDVIIIEPSGVGKLSDIEKACLDIKISGITKITNKITIVDVNKCETYYENFGEFFDNQVSNADTVVLSRTQLYPDKVCNAVNIIKGLNSKATIYSKPFDELDFNEISLLNNFVTPIIHKCNCGCHSHTHDEQHCCDNHSYDAHDCCHTEQEHHHKHAFDAVTISFKGNTDAKAIEAKMQKINDRRFGNIVRAKGIITDNSEYVNVQYVPDSLKLEKTGVRGNEICFIGKNIDESALREFFTV